MVSACMVWHTLLLRDRGTALREHVLQCHPHGYGTRLLEHRNQLPLIASCLERL